MYAPEADPPGSQKNVGIIPPRRPFSALHTKDARQAGGTRTGSSNGKKSFMLHGVITSDGGAGRP
jgi:hypothetical protein